MHDQNTRRDDELKQDEENMDRTAQAGLGGAFGEAEDAEVIRKQLRDDAARAFDDEEDPESDDDDVESGGAAGGSSVGMTPPLHGTGPRGGMSDANDSRLVPTDDMLDDEFDDADDTDETASTDVR